MDVAGKVVVITGGAWGIGRALAYRFADDGAKASSSPISTARARRRSRPTSTTRSPRLRRQPIPRYPDVLIAATEHSRGPVDLFCANAGIAVGVDLATPDGTGIWCARQRPRPRRRRRALCPAGWSAAAATSSDCLRCRARVASSAPRRTPSRSTPRSRSPNGWPSPTAIAASASAVSARGRQHGAAGLDGGSLGDRGSSRAAAPVLEPEQVADAVIDGLRDERFLILPHPEVPEYLQRKAADYDRWLAGMRRLQARVESS